MAADYIVVTRSNRPQAGSSLVSLANQLIDLRDLCRALNNAGQREFNASDYSLFEQQFGLATGTGANVLSLIGLINTILNTNAEVTGANRLLQLDEFCARLAGQ